MIPNPNVVQGECSTRKTRLLKPSEVAAALLDGTLPQRWRLEFLLGFLVVSTIMDLLSPAWPTTKVEVAGLVVSGFIAVFGVTLCYRANQRGDGRDFLDRLFCMFISVAVSSFVPLIGPVILVGLAVDESYIDITAAVCGNAWSIWLFWRVRHYLSWISHQGKL